MKFTAVLVAALFVIAPAFGMNLPFSDMFGLKGVEDPCPLFKQFKTDAMRAGFDIQAELCGTDGHCIFYNDLHHNLWRSAMESLEGNHCPSTTTNKDGMCANLKERADFMNDLLESFARTPSQKAFRARYAPISEALLASLRDQIAC